MSTTLCGAQTHLHLRLLMYGSFRRKLLGVGQSNLCCGQPDAKCSSNQNLITTCCRYTYVPDIEEQRAPHRDVRELPVVVLACVCWLRMRKHCVPPHA